MTPDELVSPSQSSLASKDLSLLEYPQPTQPEEAVEAAVLVGLLVELQMQLMMSVVEGLMEPELMSEVAAPLELVPGSEILVLLLLAAAAAGLDHLLFFLLTSAVGFGLEPEVLIEPSF